MNEEIVAETRTSSQPRGARATQNRRRYGVADKLRAVRLYREEGFSLALICQELGVGKSSIAHWIKAYQLAGEAGLQPY